LLKFSRLWKWKDVTYQKIRIFYWDNSFAGVIWKPKISSYYPRKSLFMTLGIPRIIPYKAHVLLKCLHYVENYNSGFHVITSFHCGFSRASSILDLLNLSRVAGSIGKMWHAWHEIEYTKWRMYKHLFNFVYFYIHHMQ